MFYLADKTQDLSLEDSLSYSPEGLIQEVGEESGCIGVFYNKN